MGNGRNQQAFQDSIRLAQVHGHRARVYVHRNGMGGHLLQMPGEKPGSVWIANRKSIQQAKNLITKGCEEGKRCQALITFLKEKTSPGYAGVRCLRPDLPQSCDLKYLCRVNAGTLRVEKYFAYAQKQRWKMTVVALINIIVILSPLDWNRHYKSPRGRRRFKVATDAMEAYSQAWEIMDLVDEFTDPETHLMSRAADKFFENLKADVEFRYFDSLQTDSESKIREIGRDEIRKLAEKGKKKANAEELRHDSMDWKDVAAGNNLYKLCKSIDFKEGNVTELLDEVVRSLADVIDRCIDRAADALVANTRRWARGLDEAEVSKSLYIAGKTRGLMEVLG